MPTQLDVIAALETFAPLHLAGEWDNVGLLLEGGELQRPVRKALWTIDLTDAVLQEALAAGADFIFAYHPPIFSGLKRLRRSVPQERLLLEVIGAGITVYSPHTALDACTGGIADWLLEPFAATASLAEVAPIEPSAPGAATGAGRVMNLDRAVALSELLEPLKAHLALDHLRVASPSASHAVRRVAVCPGAGGSLFGPLHSVDLYLTGEMRHHDVLTKLREGAAVILTEHTNCERGYLPRIAQQLQSALGNQVEMMVSRQDRDPLSVA